MYIYDSINNNIQKARDKIKEISNYTNKKFNTIERFENKIFLALKIIYEFDFTTPNLLKDFLDIKSFGFAKKIEKRKLINISNIDINIIAKDYPRNILTLTKFGFETYKNFLIEKFNFKNIDMDEFKYNINLKKIMKPFYIIDKITIQKIFVANYNYLFRIFPNEPRYDTYKTFKLKNPRFFRIPSLVFYLQDEIQMIEYIKGTECYNKAEEILNQYFEIFEHGPENIKAYIYCASESIKNHFIELLNNRSYIEQIEHNNPFIQFSKDYYNKSTKKTEIRSNKRYNINNKKRLNFTSINQNQSIQSVGQARWYYASKFLD